MTTGVALLLGAMVGLGTMLIVDGWRPRPPAGQLTQTGGLRRWLGTAPARAPKLVAAVAAGITVAVLTGWPVSGLLTALAVVTLPAILGPDREHQRQLARVEALAGWTELLRDTLSAAAGLQQTIAATAHTAPQPIREHVQAMARRLQAGRRLPDVLRTFADEVADPTADLIIAALLLAADRPSAHLADLLGALAATAREQAAMRTRVATSRARIRTSTRVIAATTLTMVVALVILNRQWLAPYDSLHGQAVMVVIGVLFAAGFAGLRRMATITTTTRLFHPGGQP